MSDRQSQKNDVLEIDERPAALLACELRFNFFRAMMTTAITVVGGSVALWSAAQKTGFIDPKFLIGLGLCVFSGINAFDGQMRVLSRLEQRKARAGLWERSINVITPLTLTGGVVLLVGYFFEVFQ